MPKNKSQSSSSKLRSSVKTPNKSETDGERDETGSISTTSKEKRRLYGAFGGGASVWTWRWKVGHAEELSPKPSWALGLYSREHSLSRAHLRAGENTTFRYSLFSCKSHLRQKARRISRQAEESHCIYLCLTDIEYESRGPELL